MSKTNKIFALCKNIQPVYRSILGKGNYKTLGLLKNINKKLKIISFNSNKKVFDWKIPKEWNLKNGFRGYFNWQQSHRFQKKYVSSCWLFSASR